MKKLNFKAVSASRQKILAQFFNILSGVYFCQVSSKSESDLPEVSLVSLFINVKQRKHDILVKFSYFYL